MAARRRRKGEEGKDTSGSDCRKQVPTSAFWHSSPSATISHNPPSFLLARQLGLLLHTVEPRAPTTHSTIRPTPALSPKPSDTPRTTNNSGCSHSVPIVHPPDPLHSCSHWYFALCCWLPSVAKYTPARTTRERERGKSDIRKRKEKNNNNKGIGVVIGKKESPPREPAPSGTSSETDSKTSRPPYRNTASAHSLPSFHTPPFECHVSTRAKRHAPPKVSQAVMFCRFLALGH